MKLDSGLNEETLIGPSTSKDPPAMPADDSVYHSPSDDLFSDLD